MAANTTDTAGRAREERWREEGRFFDEWAQRTADVQLPVDPLALRRYTRPALRRRFSIEYRFRTLGSLRGRRMLDVGCGDGLNAVLFALMGAEVTGLDVSAGAIEVARRRAEVNGVADRMTFLCSPVETADLADASFDVVWGDGILHHVLDELELVLDRLSRWCRPDGVLLFSEPVNLCPPLRRLRQLIPLETEHTPGERPLVSAELDLLRRYVPDLRLRHFTFLARLDRFVLKNFNYERSDRLRRALAGGIGLVDWTLLSLPLVRRLGGTCVLWGHPRASALGAAA